MLLKVANTAGCLTMVPLSRNAIRTHDNSSPKIFQLSNIKALCWQASMILWEFSISARIGCLPQCNWILQLSVRIKSVWQYLFYLVQHLCLNLDLVSAKIGHFCKSQGQCNPKLDSHLKVFYHNLWFRQTLFFANDVIQRFKSSKQIKRQRLLDLKELWVKIAFLAACKKSKQVWSKVFWKVSF